MCGALVTEALVDVESPQICGALSKTLLEPQFSFYMEYAVDTCHMDASTPSEV